MFVLVLVVLAVVVFARLAAVVRDDRPLAAPRSHTHELDPHTPRLHGVL